MTGILNLILRLAIWFLLTADLGLTNLVIGLVICLCLPRSRFSLGRLQDWGQALWHIVKVIPQAYFEAFQMLLTPHDHEEIELQRVKPNRTPGLIFLDIFVITFTPKTIVLKYRDDGWYEVHQLVPGQGRKTK